MFVYIIECSKQREPSSSLEWPSRAEQRQSQCSDGSLYTGIAKDVVARLREHYHRLPNCAKYTRSHPMKGIRCIWQTEDKVTACQLEYRIKRLTRKQKDALTAQPEKASELMEQRAQSQARLNSAESRQKKTKGQLPVDGAVEWVSREEQERIMELVKQ